MDKVGSECVSFEWFNPKHGMPVISIASYGITLSKSTLATLKNPKFVKLGYDSKNDLICIKCCDGDDVNAIKLRYSSKQFASGYVRICAKGFIERLNAYGDYGFCKNAKKYIAEYYSANDSLVASLCGKLTKIKISDPDWRKKLVKVVRNSSGEEVL